MQQEANHEGVDDGFDWGAFIGEDDIGWIDGDLVGNGRFLGGKAFADVPMYTLAETADLIAANGQTEIDEKQAGLVEAFPDLGMDAAIDFVLPFLFSTTE